MGLHVSNLLDYVCRCRMLESAMSLSYKQTIHYVSRGNKPLSKVIMELSYENWLVSVIIRLVTWVVTLIGFNLMLSWITDFLDWVPFLGSLLGPAFQLFINILATSVYCFFWAVAWISARPTYALMLLAAAALLLYIVASG